MRKHFLTGAALLLPLAITFWILKFFLAFLTSPFQKIASSFLKRIPIFSEGFWIFSSTTIVDILSFFLILLTLIPIFVLVGFLGAKVLSSSFFHFFDELFLSTPFLGPIYKNSKEITLILFTPQPQRTFQVAYFPFPTPSSKSLGLIIHTVHLESNAPHTSQLLAFIPTAPNPTVGFLLFFREEEVIHAPHISPKQAIHLILSCGSSASVEKDPSDSL